MGGRAVLTPWHRVDLGDRHFEGLRRVQHRVSIQFVDLSLRLASGQQVLAGVTGEFEPARMTAIMVGARSGEMNAAFFEMRQR